MVFRFDPCGIVCVIFTHLIVLYSDYVVVFHLVTPVLKRSLWAILNTVGFNIVAFLLLFSHICAVLTDPGLIPLSLFPCDPSKPNEKPSGWTTCNKCAIYRPPRAHHCRICRRCVRRMDHHCPWINNCVGECNQKYFIQFLVYVGVLCIYALLLILICRAMVSAGLQQDSSSPDAIVVIHTVILVAICCLFGLFILAILSDQYKSIVEDTTAVEAWQLRSTSHPNDSESGTAFQRKLSKFTLFREVFGIGPWYLWLIPCAHLFQPHNKLYVPVLNNMDQSNGLATYRNMMHETQSNFSAETSETDSSTSSNNY